MVDMKEFLEKESTLAVTAYLGTIEKYSKVIEINKLGMYYWQRGGKQFVLFNGKDEPLKIIIEQAEWSILDSKKQDKSESWGIIHLQARDFLDCLDCLGEEKVKELIKEMEMKR